MKIAKRKMGWLTGALLLWLAAAPLAQAFYNPHTGRWLSRDPIEETDGSNMYAFVRNDPTSRFDKDGRVGYYAPGPLDCTDPCGKAKRLGMDKGDAGGIVCCSGAVYACSWDAGGATGAGNRTAREIITKCTIAHERDHVKKEWCLSCGFYRPKPFPWRRGALECAAYKVELKCLEDSISSCGGDRVCVSDVKTEIRDVNSRIKEYCGDAK